MIPKCIGIISWLPDDGRRSKRIRRLNNLIKKLDSLFDLPIIVIAQDWQDGDINTSKNCVIHHYKKLGILKARRVLREKFLESKYDYLIMVDDDAIIEGNDFKQYFKDIEDHPYGFGTFPSQQLNLFAISRFAFSKCDYPDINPEKNEGFEDCCFIWLLKHKVRGVEYNFVDVNLKVKFDYEEEGYESTWYNASNLETMEVRTKAFMDKVVEMYEHDQLGY